MLSGLLRRGPPPEKHAVRGEFVKQDGMNWSKLPDAPRLEGNWDKGLFSLPTDDTTPDAPRTPVWTVVPRTGRQNRHDMADFALRLNELTPELDKVKKWRERNGERRNETRDRARWIAARATGPGPTLAHGGAVRCRVGRARGTRAGL